MRSTAALQGEAPLSTKRNSTEKRAQLIYYFYWLAAKFFNFVEKHHTSGSTNKPKMRCHIFSFSSKGNFADAVWKSIAKGYPLGNSGYAKRIRENFKCMQITKVFLFCWLQTIEWGKTFPFHSFLLHNNCRLESYPNNPSKLSYLQRC